MSNIVSVQFTRFQDLDSDGNPDGEPTLGYRIYDDYGADYNNCYDSIEEMHKAGLTPEGIFQFIDENHDPFCMTARERGVLLNGRYIPPRETEQEVEAAPC